MKKVRNKSKLCDKNNREMPEIKILPVHPLPVYEKSIGEWIETLAEANQTPFEVTLQYITKLTKNIRFNNPLEEIMCNKFYIALEELTGVPSKIFLNILTNFFKFDYWELKGECIMTGCNFKYKYYSHLWGHLRKAHNLGNGFYII